eukprot:313122-Prymnesium_polylepis.1
MGIGKLRASGFGRGLKPACVATSSTRGQSRITKGNKITQSRAIKGNQGQSGAINERPSTIGGNQGAACVANSSTWSASARRAVRSCVPCCTADAVCSCRTSSCSLHRSGMAHPGVTRLRLQEAAVRVAADALRGLKCINRPRIRLAAVALRGQVHKQAAVSTRSSGAEGASANKGRGFDSQRWR